MPDSREARVCPTCGRHLDQAPGPIDDANEPGGWRYCEDNFHAPPDQLIPDQGDPQLPGSPAGVHRRNRERGSRKTVSDQADKDTLHDSPTPDSPQGEVWAVLVCERCDLPADGPPLAAQCECLSEGHEPDTRWVSVVRLSEAQHQIDSLRSENAELREDKEAAEREVATLYEQRDRYRKAAYHDGGALSPLDMEKAEARAEAAETRAGSLRTAVREILQATYYDNAVGQLKKIERIARSALSTTENPGEPDA